MIDTLRLKDAQIVFQVAPFSTSFFFLPPRNVELIGERFAKPFQDTVWLCIVGMTVVIGIGFRKIFVLEEAIYKGQSLIPSYFFTIFSSFATICQQISISTPRTLGGRILSISFSITSFLMYNYYTSLIIASLLGLPVKSNITTLKQLSESSLKIGIENLDYVV